MGSDKDSDVTMEDRTDDQEMAKDDAAENGEPTATAEGETPAVDEPPAPTAEERVGGAEASKDAGNALLKSGDFVGACAKYTEGIGLAEPLLEKDPGEIGQELQKKGTDLYVALRLNSAQACIKQKNWADAAEHASKVLLVDKENAKALFRRATASMQFDSEGRLEESRVDLTRFVQLEPNNREAREMLQQVKDRLRESKQREKQRLSLAMQGGLYQDNHKKLDRQKLEYDEEVKRRAEADPPEDAISWEDWQKKLKEKDDEAKKKEKEARDARSKELQEQDEQRQLDAENARRATQYLEPLALEEWKTAQKNSPKKEDIVKTDELDLDEEEKKLLDEAKNKGYYHGRLGTVLSNAAPKPQRVSEPSPDPEESRLGGKQDASAWNEKAGTWEERDTTSWVKDRLSEWLKIAKVDSSNVTLPSGEVVAISAYISKVKSISGQGSIVFVRQQKRAGYNYEADLSFRISVKALKDPLKDLPDPVADETPPAADGGEAKSSSQRFDGTFTIPELGDFVQPKDITIDAKWKASAPPEHLLPSVLECLNKLRASVREQVTGFVGEYKEH